MMSIPSIELSLVSGWRGMAWFESVVCRSVSHWVSGDRHRPADRLLSASSLSGGASERLPVSSILFRAIPNLPTKGTSLDLLYARMNCSPFLTKAEAISLLHVSNCPRKLRSSPLLPAEPRLVLVGAGVRHRVDAVHVITRASCLLQPLQRPPVDEISGFALAPPLIGRPEYGHSGGAYRAGQDARTRLPPSRHRITRILNSGGRSS